MLLPLYHRTWSFLSDANARGKRKKLLKVAGVAALVLYVAGMVVYWVLFHGSTEVGPRMPRIGEAVHNNDALAAADSVKINAIPPVLVTPLPNVPKQSVVAPKNDQEEEYRGVHPDDATPVRKRQEEDEQGSHRKRARTPAAATTAAAEQEEEEEEDEGARQPPVVSPRNNHNPFFPTTNGLVETEPMEPIDSTSLAAKDSPPANDPPLVTNHHPTNFLVRLLLPLVAGFCFGFLGSVPIAGPTSAIVLKLGLQGKYQNALAIAFGGAISEATYAGIAFWGFGSFLAGAKFIVPASKLIGAVVFTVVGTIFIRSDVRPSLDSDLNASSSSSSAAAASSSKRKMGNELLKNLLLGLTMSGINPALFATYTGAIATVYGTGLLEFTLALAFLFACGVCCGITTWFYLLVSLLKKYKQRLKNQTLSAIMRALGGFLLFLGVLCAKSSIQYFFGSSGSTAASNANAVAP